MSRIPRRRLVSVALALPFSAAATLMLADIASATGPVVHRVGAGGPDACVAIGAGDHPGCDGNYSLVATEYADGSVSGQYIDRFAGGLSAFTRSLTASLWRATEHGSAV